MPNGFVGNAARRYLGDVDAAQKRALTASRNSTSGQRLYDTACEIDEICQTIFVMPHVSPGCLNVSGGVKGCLGILRDITEDAALEMRRFAREITEIGG